MRPDELHNTLFSMFNGGMPTALFRAISSALPVTQMRAVADLSEAILDHQIMVQCPLSQCRPARLLDTSCFGTSVVMYQQPLYTQFRPSAASP